ncbi:putative NBD/HSP70 family sugar kinase [Mycoplasma testudineum]|uniref:Putative NBD/HSP70 family sugar kinase n=1 Tax=Mycoplasma testudineum TaxID=244584 RepID=A0A4R6IFE9_9MOLU|nr:ROK family protein [Mycoplasma testudineum]OYD26833.1 hypothetical protein CG473_01845 [Mycoplasma testudineum]TDO20367.1 putative NBD/HSP70 family sugar kinase [Mycoplasma testudineum]
MNKTKKYLAFDIGGTNIKASIINSDLKILKDFKFKTQKNIIDQVDQLIVEVLNSTKGIDKVLVATTGIVDSKSKKVIYTNKNFYHYLNSDFSILENKYKIDLSVENDANAAALAHISEKDKNFVFVAFGTGVGGGIVKNGHLEYGLNNTAGEFGYYTMDNKRVDNYLSYSSFNKELGYRFNINSYQKDIYEKEYNHNNELRNFLNSYLKSVAELLFNIAVINPVEKIFIGGGFAHIIPEAKTKLIQEYNNLIKDTPIKTSIHFSRYGNNAAMIGMVKYEKK